MGSVLKLLIYIEICLIPEILVTLAVVHKFTSFLLIYRVIQNVHMEHLYLFKLLPNSIALDLP